jgi:hypothetical protein
VTPDPRGDVYLSVDIEADGPIPGVYSMLSIGMCVAGRYDGRRFEATDPSADTFYAELQPISDEFDQAALAISGLDRATLARDGEEPGAAMQRAADWIDRVAADHDPVFVSWPAEFDWLFTHWYFHRFLGRDPFGYAGCIDSKTFYLARSGLTVGEAAKGRLPAELQPSRAHTHNALDDAMSHAEMFATLFAWHAHEA